MLVLLLLSTGYDTIKLRFKLAMPVLGISVGVVTNLFAFFAALSALNTFQTPPPPQSHFLLFPISKHTPLMEQRGMLLKQWLKMDMLSSTIQQLTNITTFGTYSDVKASCKYCVHQYHSRGLVMALFYKCD